MKNIAEFTIGGRARNHRRILLTLGETGEGVALTFRETVLALNAKCSQ